jgi:putative membrane protein
MYAWSTWPGPWHMWGAWGFWWIFPLLMFAFVVLCVFFMMRGPWRGGYLHGDTTSSALRLLNERFAKGEISKEELEEKRKMLGRGA